MTTLTPHQWTPRSEEEKDAVRKQLDRLLEHPAFRSSQRSARFLRYVVEYWLEKNHESEFLKERTVGAELFGLDPDYDTNQYTVVRNAASDVRRRIATYYHETGHEGEIQIEIPSGSYMPSVIFSAWAESDADEPGSETGEKKVEEYGAETGLETPLPLKPGRSYWHRNRLYFISLVAIALMAGVAVWVHLRSSASNRSVAGLSGSSLVNGPEIRSELDRFWQPVLNDSPFEPVIIVCVEQLPPQPGISQVVMPAGDAFATADFARLLGFKDARFRIALANYVTLNDIQAATVLMVGGVGNRWTSYVSDGLRFHFSAQTTSNGKKLVWIEDRKNPGRRDWSLPSSSNSSGISRDYAIVARIKDPETGRWRVLAAGLDAVGTGIAARLLVDAGYLKELTGRLPQEWLSKNNIEAVISVQVVNGEAGYPQVVAYEVW